jgi:ribosomal protein L31E
VAPRQPAFQFDLNPDVSWTVSRRAHLMPVLQRLGRDVRFVRQAAARRFGYAEKISTKVIVEGSAATAVWVRPYVPREAYVRVRVASPSTVEIWRTSTSTQVGASTVSAGEHEVRLPFDELMLVMIVDAQ